jgi:hypothetical protein
MAPDEPTELEICQNLLDSWIDSMEELSEIQEAFAVEGRIDLNGKTILDVGTDCVKPVYLALKFKPNRIVGIDESLPYIASDIMLQSRDFAETEIRFYKCSFLNESDLDRVLRKEKIAMFDYVLVSKTLHHLRTGECVAGEREKGHDCRRDRAEKNCIYRFDEKEVFKRLLELGQRIIVYEWFSPHEEDDDKVRGRGGYLTTDEWKRIFSHLCRNYRVEFVRPQRFTLDKDSMTKIDLMLRKSDLVCFYIEKTNQQSCGDQPK